jgi:hypothetical protein
MAEIKELIAELEGSIETIQKELEKTAWHDGYVYDEYYRPIRDYVADAKAMLAKVKASDFSPYTFFGLNEPDE